MDTITLKSSLYQVEARLLEKIPLRRKRCGEECRGRCCGGGISVDVDRVRWILEHRYLIPLDNSISLFRGQPFIDYSLDHPELSIYTNRDELGCMFMGETERCILHSISDDYFGDSTYVKPFYCNIFPLTIVNRVVSLAYPVIIGKPDFDVMKECFVSIEEPQMLFYEFQKELRFVLGDEAFNELKEMANGI